MLLSLFSSSADPVTAQADAVLQSITKSGYHALQHSLPRKLIELQKMIENQGEPSATATLPQKAKKRKLVDGGSMPCESDLDERIASQPSFMKYQTIIKEECTELISLADAARTGVILERGRWEAQALSKALAMELMRAQQSAMNMIDMARKSLVTRAELLAKMTSSPFASEGTDLYKLALDAFDEFHLSIARQHLVDLRNIYAVLVLLSRDWLTKIRQHK